MPHLPTSDRPQTLRLVYEALRFGFVDPCAALLTAPRRVPMHRKITYSWATRMVRRYDVRLHPIPGAPQCRGRTLYFCPHRSVADFFVHKVVTDGRAATLSRMLVAGLFPMVWLVTRLDRSTWFFVRGRRKTKASFFAWLDREFERSPLEGLIVYPEGHRHHGREPLPLRAGMIRYAFERGLPIQVVMTANTELVIDERRRRFRRGVTVPYRFYPPIRPEPGESAGSFRGRVSDCFRRAFAEIVAGGA
ncbi:MAG: hypothetical protein D6718_08825 [Acidobacteria bacterium]|nr:MAG: hypothetical protein D6718_08825 [Acidobacteriota bacterium]